MEELKDSGVSAASDTEPQAGRKFSLRGLSKRTLLIGVVAVLACVSLIAGVFVYRASAERKQVAAAASEKARKASEAREHAEAERREEMLRAAAEARRSHEAIMAASPSLPAVAKPVARATVVAPPVPVPAAPSPPDRDAAKSIGAGAPRPAPETPSRKAEAAPTVTTPDAAGGCTLRGSSAEDYGKALGRCLEEYNRLEGRSR